MATVVDVLRTFAARYPPKTAQQQQLNSIVVLSVKIKKGNTLTGSKTAQRIRKLEDIPNVFPDHSSKIALRQSWGH